MPVIFTTDLPSATTPSTTVDSNGDLAVSWTDTINYGDFRVQIRENGESTWSGAAGFAEQALGEATTSTTFVIGDAEAYDVRIRTETEHVSTAYTNPVTEVTYPRANATTSTLVSSGLTPVPFAYPATPFLRVTRPDGTKENLTPVQSLNIVREHTAPSDFRASVPLDLTLENYRFNDVEIWDGAEFLFSGEIQRISSREGSATTTVEGPDEAYQLERGEATVNYTNIAAWQAIQDYLDNYSPIGGTSYEPSASAGDETRQQTDTTSEFEGVFGGSIAPTDPLVIQNGGIELVQTAFVREGENPDSSSGDSFTNTSDSNLSNAEAVGYRSNAASREYQFTPSYDVPEGAFDVAYRNSGSTDPPVLNWRLKGPDISTVSATTNDLLSLSWFTGGLFSNNGVTTPSLSAGNTYTVEAYVDSNSAGGSRFLDVLHMKDTRFSYDYDNTTDSNDALATPQTFPDAVQAFGTVVESSLNIDTVDLSTTWNDVTNSQAIAMSFDGGASYLEATNTETATLDGQATTTVEGRITLSRYSTGGTSTPTQGNAGQRMSYWEININGNTLGTIDDTTFTGSHLENLQRLCRLAGMRFVVKHSPDGPTIEAFRAGGKSASADWDTVDRTRVVEVGDYANDVVMKGARKADGTRITQSTEDTDEINAIGRVTRTFTDPSLDTEADVKSASRTRLSQLVGEDRLTGTIQIIPTLVDPGYEYQIDAWNESIPLERVTYEFTPNGLRGTLKFDSPLTLGDAVNKVSQESRKNRDAL